MPMIHYPSSYQSSYSSSYPSSVICAILTFLSAVFGLHLQAGLDTGYDLEKLNHQSRPFSFDGFGMSGLIAMMVPDQCGTLSVYGEGANAQLRLDGTVAYWVDDANCVKGTVDYLSQRGNYRPIEIEKKWAQQTSYGLSYLNKIDLGVVTAWELGVYLSVACDKKLSKWPTVRLGDDGELIALATHRYLTGAVSYGMSGGFHWNPYCGTELKALLNYDIVDYNAKLYSLGTKEGFGVTVRCCQRIMERFVLEVEGALRRPFNYGKAALRWQLPWMSSACERWSLGIWGALANARQKGIPGHALIGIELAYWPGEPFFEMPKRQEPLCSAWEVQSSYYAPLVLAIPECKVCMVPRFSR